MPGAAAPLIEQALLDFRADPGRYDIPRRQPAVLFDSLEQVLQIATGRERAVEGAVTAARLFVRQALLRPGTSHYALLGLARGADTTEVKKRYRLMMRLLHPDFASARDAWPADAAVRVNLAYETLSSPERRRAYDQQLGGSPAHPDPLRRTAAAQRKEVNVPASRGRGMRIAIGASFAIAMAFLAVLAFTDSPSGDQIVQHLRPAQAAPLAPPLADPELAPTGEAAPATGAPMAESALPRGEPSGRVGAPEIVPAPASGESLRQVASETSTAAPPAAADASAPRAAGPTMAEAHPIIATLLQLIDRGQPAEVVALLEPGARSTAETDAFVHALVEASGRSRRLAGVELRGEPRDGRLIVTGTMKFTADVQGEPPLLMRAEFAHRNGTVVLTRLAPGS